MTEINEIDREKSRKILKSDMDKIITNINKKMQEKKLSQNDLAFAIRSNQPHVNYMLRQRGNGITIRVLSRIAIALNTSISELAK